MKARAKTWFRRTRNAALPGAAVAFPYKCQSSRYFLKSDKSSLEEKLRYTLMQAFQSRLSELRRLPNGTQYGCDGIFVEYTRYNLMFTLCLFKSK
ncbi:hypothetical protein OSTOST_10642 [Ostertagia ostertagi]